MPDTDTEFATDFNVPWDADGFIEALTLNLGDERFAIEAYMVQEILDPVPETYVPGSPTLVPGIINFRGRVIPLADLHLAFNMPPAPVTINSRIVVIECDLPGHTSLIGIKADCVHEVTSIPRTLAEQPPTVGLRWPQAFIRCLIRHEDGPIVIPNLKNIFVILCGRNRPTHMSLH